MRLATRHGCSVVGISTSARGITIAAAAGAARAARAEFFVRDGGNTGFAEGRFDAAWMIEVADLIPDKAGLFTELARVLVPGGKLVFANNVALRRMTFREAFERREHVAAMGRIFGQLSNAGPDEYAGWLARAGFERCSQHDLTREVGPTLHELRARLPEYAERAAVKLKEIVEGESLAGQGLRLRVMGGGCAGFTYDLFFDAVLGGLDEQLESRGVSIYVDAISYQYLEGTEIDYVESPHGSGFKFNNPKVKSTCVCGSSFSV
jgi:iron-sulfur cluster insertion protein